MNRAQKLIALINEDKFINKLLSDVVKRIRELSSAHKVFIKTDLNKVEREMKNIVSKLPTDKTISRLKAIQLLNGNKFESKDNNFKSRYILLLKDFINTLNKLQIGRPWLDIKKIINPLLKLELKE